MKKKYFDSWTGADDFAKQKGGVVHRECCFGRFLYYVEYED